MKPLLVIGAGGLLLWYLNSKGYLSGLFGATSTPVIGAPPPAPGAGTTPPAGYNLLPGTPGAGTTGTPGFNSLAAIYIRLQADAKAPTTGLSAYGWNYSLARVSSITPPDPDPLWAAAGSDPSQNMTAAQYWSIMAPALTAQFGLSGMRGLGSAYWHDSHGGWAV